jgi:radical SAM superfamily enzyme YgiQ (UPF0313 family)
LVAISALSAQASAAYRAADQLRARGVQVVIGGLHASVEPQEALDHADAVVIGEGESVWPALVSAAAAGSLRPEWRASDYAPVDVRLLPTPRYDLLDLDRYRRLPVQTSRGCPWRCDFCASSVMLRQTYRTRPVESVIRDVLAIQSLRRRPFLELADDNTFVDKAWGRELCEQLEPLGVNWFAETDVSVADDEELLTAIRQSGGRQLLIGLESPEPQALEGVEMRANFKARRWAGCREAVRRIQDHGIAVNGCFVLGLDGHSPEIFQEVWNFATELPLFDVQITVLTPFPGTPLYARLLEEGRILQPRRWDLCTLFDVNFVPRGMSVEELRAGLYWLAERLYSAQCVETRQRGFFERQVHRAKPTRRGSDRQQWKNARSS